MKSQLLDNGKGVIFVYPEITVTNSRGDKVKIPSDTPVKVKVSMSKDRNSSAELPGQVEVKIIRCVTRKAPVSGWAKIIYNDEEWDLTAPPHVSEGTSKTTRNTTFTLRSRNDVEATP